MPYSFDFKQQVTDNGWEDSWWVCIGENMLEAPMSLEEALAAGKATEDPVYLMHVQMASVEGADWEQLEIPKVTSRSASSAGQPRAGATEAAKQTGNKASAVPASIDDPLNEQERKQIIDLGLVPLSQISTLTGTQAHALIARWKRRKRMAAMFRLVKNVAVLVVLAGFGYGGWWAYDNFLKKEPPPVEVEEEVPAEIISTVIGQIGIDEAVQQYLEGEVELLVLEDTTPSIREALDELFKRYNALVNKEESETKERVEQYYHDAFKALVEAVPVPGEGREYVYQSLRISESDSGSVSIHNIPVVRGVPPYKVSAGRNHYRRIQSILSVASLELIPEIVERIHGYVDEEIKGKRFGSSASDSQVILENWADGALSEYTDDLKTLHSDYQAFLEGPDISLLDQFMEQAQEVQSLMESWLKENNYAVAHPESFGDFSVSYVGKPMNKPEFILRARVGGNVVYFMRRNGAFELEDIRWTTKTRPLESSEQ